MGMRRCKLYGAIFAMGIGFIGQAKATDFMYHCDDVLYSAKISAQNYKVVLCVSGDKINFNYGPIDGASEVDVLLDKSQVWYVPQYDRYNTATGRVGIKFVVGRYHYHIHDELMIFRVGVEERDTETVPLRKPEVDLNVAKLVKYQLKPE